MAPTQPLTKRWSTCTYYDTSCSNYRTAIIVVIIAVVILKILVISLFITRHYKRKAAREMADRRAHETIAMQVKMSNQAAAAGAQSNSPYVAASQWQQYGMDEQGEVEPPPPAYVATSPVVYKAK